MKAVYIGAGIDIRPIKFLKHIKIFSILMDYHLVILEYYNQI